MRVSAEIIDFSLPGKLMVFKDEFVIHAWDIWLTNPLRRICCNHSEFDFSSNLSSDGICVVNNKSVKAGFPPTWFIYDYSGNEILNVDMPRDLPGYSRVKDYYVLHRLSPRKGLAVYKMDGHVFADLNIESYYSISDGELIYVRMKTPANEFYCVAYDIQLKEIWSVRFSISESDLYDDVDDGPRIYAGLVIFNIGRSIKDGLYEIGAFKGVTGSPEWLVRLPAAPITSRLIDGKIYAFSLERAFVVDAENGRIIADFFHCIPVDCNPRIFRGFLFPFCNNLICVGGDGKVLYIRSHDGFNLIQKITIPDPFCCILSGDHVVSNEDACYIRVSNMYPPINAMQSGVLILRPNKEAAECIEASLEPRPDFKMMTVAREDALNEDIFVVSVSHDNLDDIVRHSIAVMSEIALYRGSFDKRSKLRNKKHKGKIDLIIDSVPLSHLKKTNTELRDYFSVINAVFEKCIDLAAVKILAGDGKSKFSLNVQVI